jgi:hypothetical protein
MPNVADLNQEAIQAVRKSYSAVKTLKEERKSMSEDISEEKKDCAKKSGMAVKDLNAIFKILENRENGNFSEDYVTIAKAVEGITDISKKAETSKK